MIRTASLLSSFLALTACGSAPLPEPVVVRASDPSALARVDPKTRPVIIEVDPGDAIPLTVSVDGDLIATPPGQAPVTITARRRFFVRATKDGLALSLDGVHWDPKRLARGAIAFGFGVTAASGARANLTITTPTLAQ